MEPILQVQNLTHTYSAGTPFEHTALENVSFSIDRGEFIGVIGHTGSGKSTLMQHLNGLLKPTSGSVLLNGKDMWSDKVFTREMLLEKVWGYEYYGDVRTVDVTIRRLREKIEDDPSLPNFVLTKRGVGYCFNKDNIK